MRSGSLGPAASEPVERERAVSDLIGFVLVFSLIAAIVAIVSLAGLGSLEDARDAQQTDNAERAMEVLSDNMADITERGAPSRATEVSLEDASMYMGEDTLIEVRDPDNGDPSFLTTRVYKVTPIVYEDENAKLIYVNGAVFREGREGGIVLQSWEPVLDEERTIIPIINTASATGDSQLISSTTVLVRANRYQRLVPVTDDTGVYDNVWINVTSERSDLWKRMLESENDLDCNDAGPDRIECKLDLGSPPNSIYVTETRIAIALKP